MDFKWSEIILYILPIVTLVFVATYGRRFLYINDKIKFAPVDVVLPIVLISIHFISTYLLLYSLLPHLIVLVSLIAIFVLIRKFIKNEEVVVSKFIRMLLNISAVISFVVYVLLVVLRIIQLLIG